MISYRRIACKSQIQYRPLAILAATAILGGCGSVGDLEPAEGRALPPAAYGAKEQASAATLIKAEMQTRPGRSDELLRRSERREKDPFDLPPGGGITDKQKEESAPAPSDTASEMAAQDAIDIAPAPLPDSLPQ